MNTTSFSLVYDSFLSKITDDMYLELTELDTFRMLEQLLLSAIEKFEFPRINLWDYELFEISDQSTYCGVESGNIEVQAIIYNGGYFNGSLTHEEINILAVYMIVEWLSQQLASIENTRMKYSGSDFKFTSQANHMQKLLQIKKDYEREGFHLQRLYKRRIQDKRGVMRSTLGVIMQPTYYPSDSDLTQEAYRNRNVINYQDLINKPKIETHTLIGDQTFDELDMSRIDYNELDNIFSGE